MNRFIRRDVLNNKRQLLFMKRSTRLLMVLAALYPLGMSARGIADIIASLENTGCYEAKANFSVTLPQSDKDVIYNIHLTSSPAPDDTLAPCSYRTDWQLETPSGKVEGFSAYFNGHHYRYRNERLQEYHFEWDSIPFLLGGKKDGVQTNAQFSDLYPGFIARELRSMTTDPHYSLKIEDSKIFDGKKAVEITALMTINDITAAEKKFIFDATSLLPLKIDTESNPGQITEQSVVVTYIYPQRMHCPDFNEKELAESYPDAFDKYRENNFKIENLAGTQLPTFSLPTTTGERYTYHRGNNFRAPTIIVLLDPTAGFNSEIVNEVRSAVDNLPVQTDVIWVFNSTNLESIETIVPSIKEGEHLLMNGRSLVRDCGAASLPVLIMADSKGKVRNVTLGLNKDLGNIVLQTMALLD